MRPTHPSRITFVPARDRCLTGRLGTSTYLGFAQGRRPQGGSVRSSPFSPLVPGLLDGRINHLRLGPEEPRDAELGRSTRTISEREMSSVRTAYAIRSVETTAPEQRAVILGRV